MKNLLILILTLFIFSCKKEKEIIPNFSQIIIKDKARLEALTTTTQSVYFTFKSSSQNPVIQYSKMKVWYFTNSATETQLNQIIQNSTYNLSNLGTPALSTECNTTSYDNNYIRKILGFNTKAIIQFYFQNSTSPEASKYINIQLQLIPKVVAIEGVLKNTLYQRVTVTNNLSF